MSGMEVKLIKPPQHCIYIYISRMIKIEYPTMVPLARRIQKDTKRLDSDKLDSLASLSVRLH